METKKKLKEKPKNLHLAYHSPVLDSLFRCLCLELAVICDVISWYIICYIFLNLAHMALIMVYIALRVYINISL